MAPPKKKPDPINDKARALNDEIAALEEQIKKLDAQLQRTPTPKFRSTATPQGITVPHTAERPAPPPPKPEPVFEDVKINSLKSEAENETPEVYNELGVRKYDLPAFWSRIRNHFRGPTTNNPRLVTYLAAGGVQGLKPLRYEKRVARNRFLLVVFVLFAILLGIASCVMQHHR